MKEPTYIRISHYAKAHKMSLDTAIRKAKKLKDKTATKIVLEGKLFIREDVKL